MIPLSRLQDDLLQVLVNRQYDYTESSARCPASSVIISMITLSQLQVLVYRQYDSTESAAICLAASVSLSLV